MKYFIKSILLITALFFLFIKTAQAVSSPIDMLQTTSNQMIQQLNAHEATLRSDPNTVIRIVDAILLPHVDMYIMSRSVVGRNAWSNATPAQQRTFISEFTDLLIRTYAAALAAYTNQTVQFNPIRGGWGGQSQVQVDSQIIQPQGPSVPVSYQLVLEGAQWKVIDFSVDGVSIVENFRAQFANDLNSGGLDTLNVKLAEHNQRLAQQQS